MNSIYIALFVVFFGNNSEKLYQKDYFANGNLKAEGWMVKDQKVDYWFFYYDNNTKKEEGHYTKGQKSKWWTFYNSNGEIVKKCEFLNGKMNGFSIVYSNGEVIRAEKYKFGEKIDQWTSIAEFKKDNSL